MLPSLFFAFQGRHSVASVLIMSLNYLWFIETNTVTGLSQRLGAVGQSEQWTKHSSLFPVPSRPLLEALIVS